uniref:Uncharacterized protein n=1 Tax=Anguilla anguilla TaxID=7936 RepID=A0A0E9PR76_ANGAN
MNLSFLNPVFIHMFNFTPVLIGKLYLWAHQSLSSKASSPSHPFSLQSITRFSCTVIASFCHCVHFNW